MRLVSASRFRSRKTRSRTVRYRFATSSPPAVHAGAGARQCRAETDGALRGAATDRRAALLLTNPDLLQLSNEQGSHAHWALPKTTGAEDATTRRRGDVVLRWALGERVEGASMQVRCETIGSGRPPSSSLAPYWAPCRGRWPVALYWAPHRPPWSSQAPPLSKQAWGASCGPVCPVAGRRTVGGGSRSRSDLGR